MKNHTNYWFEPNNHKLYSAALRQQCTSLIPIGSQSFAQVLLCFSSGAAVLYCSKTLGTRMILTVEWEMGKNSIQN